MITENLERFFTNIPLITFYYILCGSFVTLLYSLDFLDLYYILFNWLMVYHNRHLWRIFTNFFFIGKLSFNWFMLVSMFVQMSTNLEHDVSFSHSKGAYLYFIFFQMCLISILSIFFYWPIGGPFLFESLHFSITYLWSKLNKHTSLSIYFITIKGYQLPIILFLFNLVTGGSPTNYIIGLISGHVFYYMRDLVPGGCVLVKTPPVFNRIAFSMDKHKNNVMKLFKEGPPRRTFVGRGSTLN